MQLAFYKGPARTLGQRLFHWLVCAVTGGLYSHVELVINGICYSSSPRDHGVRSKRMDLTSGRWDVVDLPGLHGFSEADAVVWFAAHAGEGYDTLGLLGFVLPWRIEDRRKYFCSEAIAAALSLEQPWRWSPADLANAFLQGRATA